MVPMSTWGWFASEEWAYVVNTSTAFDRPVVEENGSGSDSGGIEGGVGLESRSRMSTLMGTYG